MLTMVIGGVRSGKSAVAERRAAAAAGGGAVTYLATAPAGGDDALRDRIATHRARRPAQWTTVEVAGPAAVDALADHGGVVLLDSLGTWLAGHVDFVADIDHLAGTLRARNDPTVVVSEEVGLSVHPPTDVGRRFADALGLLNQAVAAIADEVVLVVAGRELVL